MPPRAKETTAARAAISMTAGFRWRTSAKTAARAKATPAAFRRSGPAREGRGVDGAGRDCAGEACSGEDGVDEERLGRRRSCRSRAATPMAATTTKDSGLRKARRLV